MEWKPGIAAVDARTGAGNMGCPLGGMPGLPEPLRTKRAGGSVRFHTDCEAIAPGCARAGAMLSGSGAWHVFLRVRTTDQAPDIGMVLSIANELKIGLACKSSHTFEEGRVVVALHTAGAGGAGFYEVSLKGRNPAKLKDAMKTVDRVGLEMVIAKEIAQDLMGNDITAFMQQMAGEPALA